MTIGQRLGLAFALLLAVLGGFILHVRETVYEVSDQFRVFLDTSRARFDHAHDFERDLLYGAISVRNYINFPTDDYRARMEESIIAAYANLHALERNRHELPDGAERLASIRETLDRYFESGREFVRRAIDGEEVVRLEQQLTVKREQMLTEVRDMAKTLNQQALEHFAQVEQELHAMKNRIRIVAIFALVLFALLGYLMARSIRQPIRRLVSQARRWQSGDYHALSLIPGDAVRDRGGSTELDVLATTLGKAAESVRLRERRLAADTQLCRQMMVSLDAARLGAAMLRGMVKHLEASGALLYRWDEADQQLVPLAGHRLLADGGAVALGEGLPGQAAQARAPAVLSDIPAQAPASIRLGYDVLSTSHAAAWPVLYAEQLLGVLVVASLRPFDADAMAFMDSAANLLALGLRNSATHERLADLLEQMSQRTAEIERAHEELQARNEEIQTQNRRLVDVTEVLRQHAERIHVADEHKSEFLATLAHELRNPMAPIRTSVALLRRGCPDDEPTRTAIDTIERQSRHLTRLIDDLLDITRISRGKITLQRQRVDLVRLVADCVQDHRSSIEAKAIHLHLDAATMPLTVDVDPDRIVQVIGNLLHNAMKFTPQGGRITVAVASSGSEAIVSITDSGEGIDAELMRNLFKPFSQGPLELDRRHGGLGLGLALVKGLVDQHGGRIEVDSAGRGQGSRFLVALPCLSEAADNQPQGETASSQPPRRVLIVDDNLDAASTLKLALEWERYTVAVAHDGPSAITVADEFEPDAILCDIGLPGIDGYEVARRLRASAAHRDVLLLAITGYATDEDRERSRVAGFDLHLVKPVDFERLSTTLAQMRVGAR